MKPTESQALCNGSGLFGDPDCPHVEYCGNWTGAYTTIRTIIIENKDGKDFSRAIRRVVGDHLARYGWIAKPIGNFKTPQEFPGYIPIISKKKKGD